VTGVQTCALPISILRTRPDIVAIWSDREVAIRWLTHFPRRNQRGNPIPPIEEEIRVLTDCPERIAKLRKRLCSLSWFMGRLNEFIARAANKEDGVKGRFWEARFKCQALLDDAAIAACMVYVDLNPIRAGLAAIPEESDFTSIQERIRAWRQETSVSAPTKVAQDIHPGSLRKDVLIPENISEISKSIPERLSVSNFPDGGWLCPISSEPQRRGILQMTVAEYFDLVDKSGRMARSDKRGAIDAHLAPILLRIGANPDAWIDTVSRFGCKFRLAAGLLPNLRNFAAHLGRRWLMGVATARTAFASSQPQFT
jgi:putative transposase